MGCAATGWSRQAIRLSKQTVPRYIRHSCYPEPDPTTRVTRESDRAIWSEMAGDTDGPSSSDEVECNIGYAGWVAQRRDR